MEFIKKFAESDKYKKIIFYKINKNKNIYNS